MHTDELSFQGETFCLLPILVRTRPPIPHSNGVLVLCSFRRRFLKKSRLHSGLPQRTVKELRRLPSITVPSLIYQMHLTDLPKVGRVEQVDQLNPRSGLGRPTRGVPCCIPLISAAHILACFDRHRNDQREQAVSKSVRMNKHHRI